MKTTKCRLVFIKIGKTIDVSEKFLADTRVRNLFKINSVKFLISEVTKISPISKDTFTLGQILNRIFSNDHILILKKTLNVR